MAETDLAQSCHSIDYQTGCILFFIIRYAALSPCVELKAENAKVAFKGGIDNNRMLKAL